MTINNKTVGPATYLARVSELIGREADPGPALLAYGRGVSAEAYVAQPRVRTPPPPDPMILRPFEVQDHSDDGRIDWHHKAGEFLSREAVEAELKRLGIPYTISES
jgi:hypothetical protein